MTGRGSPSRWGEIRLPAALRGRPEPVHTRTRVVQIQRGVRNGRFLIGNGVRVASLASHLLGQADRPLAELWPRSLRNSGPVPMDGGLHHEADSEGIDNRPRHWCTQVCCFSFGGSARCGDGQPRSPR